MEVQALSVLTGSVENFHVCRRPVNFLNESYLGQPKSPPSCSYFSATRMCYFWREMDFKKSILGDARTNMLNVKAIPMTKEFHRSGPKYRTVVPCYHSTSKQNIFMLITATINKFYNSIGVASVHLALNVQREQRNGQYLFIIIQYLIRCLLFKVYYHHYKFYLFRCH